MLYKNLRSLGLRRSLVNSITPLQSTPPLLPPLYHLSSYAYKFTTIHRFSSIDQLYRSLHNPRLQKKALSMAVRALFWMFSVSLTCLIAQADGNKITDWADKSTGEFQRRQSQFRNHISNKPGAEFPAEKDRFHLYVSYACPWGKSPKSARTASLFAENICSSAYAYRP